ncbi:MAG TPA: hypothetical protein VF267_14120 [Gammaproteobacteria bacterium]
MNASTRSTAEQLRQWPEEAREAAGLVVDEYGEPDEITETQLVWHNVGPWKRVVATKTYYPHNFPAPHNDSVESFIDYKVPADKFTALAEFDGSVIAERTAGEVSARCHDLQANMLALNLMHDIVTGQKTAQQAREYYAKEFADYRRKKPTPYMEKLHFAPMSGSEAPDPDERMLSKEQLERAVAEGRQQQRQGAAQP